MNAQRNWLCTPDIPDAPRQVVDIETEQQEYLTERIGWVMWAALEEMENAPRTG